MDKQRTISKELSLKGIGLHTGNAVNLKFKPAEVNTGINFIRIDLPDRPVIKASIENLLSSSRAPRRTSLGKDSIEIHTIEHLMAALSGLGIDNLNIEIDNDEVPGLDGSSLNFLEILLDAGIKEQENLRQYYLVKEPIFVEEENSSIVVLPSQEFKISYTLNYNHPLLKVQFMELGVNPGLFKMELAPARTFCLEEEAKELQSQGLGRGANYSNTLVIGKRGVIKNKLRFQDEFIRHKVLDLIGDMSLLSMSFIGHITAYRSGHNLNTRLATAILDNSDKWIEVGQSEKDLIV